MWSLKIDGRCHIVYGQTRLELSPYLGWVDASSEQILFEHFYWQNVRIKIGLSCWLQGRYLWVLGQNIDSQSSFKRIAQIIQNSDKLRFLFNLY